MEEQKSFNIEVVENGNQFTAFGSTDQNSGLYCAGSTIAEAIHGFANILECQGLRTFQDIEDFINK
jgi:hypothetical protein